MMNHLTRSQSIASFAILLTTVLVAGALGAAASLDAASFYAQLTRPVWAPPAGVFGPAWSVLYLLMTTAAWLVVRARGWQATRVELLMFLVQLILNALWSWLFFAWHMGAAALIEVIALWLAIAVTLGMFWRVRRAAGALMIPYLLWVSFATALTAAVYKLNPQLL